MTELMGLVLPSPVRGQLGYANYIDLEPLDHVCLGQLIAEQYAQDAPLRRVASLILHNTRDILRDGGGVIARWIRRNTIYHQESPGVEILQGPYTSLRYKVVDCDDAAILWVALTRAVGLRTYFVGLGYRESAQGEITHALGFDSGTGRHWELSADGRYGGAGSRSELFEQPPGTYLVFCDWHHPRWPGWWVKPYPAHSYQPTTRAQLGASEDETPMWMSGKTGAPRDVSQMTQETSFLDDIATFVGTAVGAAIEGESDGRDQWPNDYPVENYSGQVETVSRFPTTALVIGGVVVAGVLVYLVTR